MQLTYENVVIGITAALYISVGVSYFIKGNIPLSIVWAAYGVANIGLIMAILNKA